ncbi:MAG TPA: ATP-binding protein [Xanthobacteraceae bacterium]|jgi:two-component system phosphate regulon sensor histidine kinase PhoR
MTDTQTQSGSVRAAERGVRGRLFAARWVIAAAVALLIVLLFLGRVSWPEAAFALVVILAAAAIRAPVAAVATPPPQPVSSRVPFAVDPQLGAVIGALPGPALLVNRRGTILVGNDAVVATLGPVRRGEPITFTVRAPEVIEALRAAIDGTPRRVQFTERVPVERTFEANVVPIFFEHAGESDKPDAFLITFDDLTQQHRLDRMRADFVANASHELRTPLASLSGFVETLQGSARTDSAARERFLGIMAEQARRMSRLIDDLLSLSRVELNEHLHPQHEVDLVPIVGHVCDTLSPLARERGVDLVISRNAEHLRVLGERDELIRLFENLVENALKYGASGKRVEVTVAEEPSGEAGEAVVTVRDFGPGISPEHLPRLTERFYRVDVETSRAEGGTGLGLAIVKHILARHRGRLSIESEVGRGAAFAVRIPLSTGSLDSTQGKSSS